MILTATATSARMSFLKCSNLLGWLALKRYAVLKVGWDLRSSVFTLSGNENLSMEDLNEFSEEMASLFAENAFDTLDTNGGPHVLC